MNVSSTIEFDSEEESSLDGDGTQLHTGGRLHTKRGRIKFRGRLSSDGLMDVSAGELEFSGPDQHRIGGLGMKAGKGSKLRFQGNLSFEGELASEGHVNLTKGRIKFSSKARHQIRGEGIDVDKDSAVDIESNVSIGGKGLRSSGEIRLKPRSAGSRRLLESGISVASYSSLLISAGGLQSYGSLYIPAGSSLIYNSTADLSVVGGAGVENTGKLIVLGGTVNIVGGGITSFGFVEVGVHSSAAINLNHPKTDTSLFSGDGLMVTAPGKFSVAKGTVEFLSNVTGALTVGDEAVVYIHSESGMTCSGFGKLCRMKGQVTVDCDGAWETCTPSCADITYTVKTESKNGGRACVAGHGYKTQCLPGDGQCKTAAPPPPEAIEINVTSKVYSPAEQASAEKTLSLALAAARGKSAKEAPVVTLKSALTFPIAIGKIGDAGSPEYMNFKDSFESAMSLRLGNLKVTMTAVGAARRRQMLGVASAAAQQHPHRRLGDAVKVDFYTTVPLSVATEAASLVTTLKSSSKTIDVKIGGTTFSADPKSLLAPKVTKAPNVDCIGNWGACSTACQKVFNVTKVAAGAGDLCAAAHGTAARCCKEGAAVKGGGARAIAPAVTTLLLATVGWLLN